MYLYIKSILFMKQTTLTTKINYILDQTIFVTPVARLNI